MEDPLPRLSPLMLVLALGAASTGAAQELKFSPSSAIRDGEVVEVFVDERGAIYRELRYHGVVPNYRDDLGHRRPRKNAKAHVKRRAEAPKITWVGFQQQRFSSRIFIQASLVSHFSITKPDPHHIVVFIDDAKIPGRQALRPLVTSQYASSVAHVQARRKRHGAEITITLSRPAGYLYKQDGRYIFIDVER